MYDGTHVGFVQLGRYGDILNILPLCREYAKSYTVHMVVAKEFANILDGVTYVTADVVNIDVKDFAAANEYAKKTYANVCTSQVDGNGSSMKTGERNFTLANWANVDPRYVAAYQTLPLVLDNRNAEREKWLVDSIEASSLPRVLVNFEGHSTPMHNREEVFDRLWKYCLNKYWVLNIGLLRVRRLYDMLGSFEKADLLVTVDTSTLHLGYAVKIPTIAITSSKPWYASERRKHWIGTFTVDEIEGKVEELGKVIDDFLSCSESIRSKGR